MGSLSKEVFPGCALVMGLGTSPVNCIGRVPVREFLAEFFVVLIGATPTNVVLIYQC